MGWYRHPVYAVAHVVLGFLSVWSPLLLVLVITYQIGQYLLDIRAFPLERRIEPGNSVEHTALKLAEVGFGYFLGLTIKT